MTIQPDMEEDSCGNMVLGKVRKSQARMHTNKSLKQKWCGAGRTDKRGRVDVFLIAGRRGLQM